MKKTKEYLERQYEHYCDKYWGTNELIVNKQKEILKLEGEVKSLKEVMETYDDKRNEFNEMLNEIRSNDDHS